MHLYTTLRFIFISSVCFVLLCSVGVSGTKSNIYQHTKPSSATTSKVQISVTHPQTASAIASKIQASAKQRLASKKATSEVVMKNGKVVSDGKTVSSKGTGKKRPMNDIANFIIMKNVDMAFGGYGGMRNVGYGSVSTTTPVTGSILKAYLYWSGPTNSTDPSANANVTFNGNNITGTNIGISGDNCWGFTNSQAYRADVTGLVSTGTGPYTLTNFENEVANVNGVSLVVFYDDGDSTNNHDYVLFDGNDSNYGNDYDADGWNVTLNGINYTSGNVSMILHVGDGQVWLDNAVDVNGTPITSGDSIFQGITVPYDTSSSENTNGGMWDIESYDITSFMTPGTNNLTLTTGVPGSGFDCLSLVLAVVQLPVGSAPGEFGTGQIAGMKFQDTNGNGVMDSSETGIQNWQIVLSGAASETTVTNPLGRYSFKNLLPGTYMVSEINQSGWTESFPPETSYTVTLDSGETVDTLNFGNIPPPAMISGYKFNDLNGNGYWDEGEPPIQYWKIYLNTYLSEDNYVTVDSACTDSNGKYTFSNLNVGWYYYVTEQMKSNWTQTTPYYGYYELYIGYPGQILSNNNFGNMLNPAHFTYDRECVFFPSTPPGDTVTQWISVTNDGAQPGQILNLQTSSCIFTATLCGDSTLNPGDWRTIKLTFQPPCSGDFEGQLAVVTNVSSGDDFYLAGQGQFPGTDVGQQIFSGLASIQGTAAPKNSLVGALTKNGDLIEAVLVQIPPDSITNNINYAMTLQVGQAGIAAGDTIYFGIASDCDFWNARFCGYTVFNPQFPPPSGYTLVNVDGENEQTTSTPLYCGYNAVSWNVMPNDQSVNSVFGSTISNGNVKIILDYVNDGSSNPRFDYYIPALGQYNPLQQTDFRKGYFVYMTSSYNCPLQVSGTPVCPELPIPVNSGYNFVSYLPTTNDNPGHAFQSLGDNLNEALSWNNNGGDGYFDFYPDGSFYCTMPGYGYFVNVGYPGTLTYPSYSPDSKAPVQKMPSSIAHRKTMSDASMPQAMFAYGKNVQLNGTLVPKGTVVKAVNADGVVCGTAKFLADGVFAVPILADNPATMAIEGARQGEQLKIIVGDHLLGERVQWTKFGDTKELSGELTSTIVSNTGDLPTQFALHQNYPNPFNPTTTIKYDLPKSASVTLTVFNMLGQQVRTLVSQSQDAGFFTVTWDGRDNFGQTVASGIYTYRLIANSGATSVVQTQKMIMMK